MSISETNGTYLIASMTDVVAVYMFNKKVIVIEQDGTVTEILRTGLKVEHPGK